MQALSDLYRFKPHWKVIGCTIVLQPLLYCRHEMWCNNIGPILRVQSLQSRNRKILHALVSKLRITNLTLINLGDKGIYILSRGWVCVIVTPAQMPGMMEVVIRDSWNDIDSIDNTILIQILNSFREVFISKISHTGTSIRSQVYFGIRMMECIIG